MPRPEKGGQHWVAVTYRDLADRPYATTIEITCAPVEGEPQETLRVTDTRFGSVPFTDPLGAPRLPSVGGRPRDQQPLIPRKLKDGWHIVKEIRACVRQRRTDRAKPGEQG